MTYHARNESGRIYINMLMKEALNHQAINHPYLKKLISGDVPDIKKSLADFVYQYSAYTSDFVRYLAATISQLDNVDHRKALLTNLTEESGRVDAENTALLESFGIKPEWVVGIPHTELYARHLVAMGVDADYRIEHPYSDDALIWKNMFLSLCSTQGPERALGAIGIGTESIVKYIYRQLIEAFEKHLDISKQDRVFFDLHAILDDQHGDTLTEIAVDYAEKEENRPLIREGMLMALGMRGAFFDALEHRAMNTN